MIENNKGSVMVEASIYFPLVLCSVIVVLYMGLFKLQENIFFYYADSYSSYVAREEVYPGYDELVGSYAPEEYEWSGGLLDSLTKDSIVEYNDSRTSSLAALYREFDWFGSPDESSYENALEGKLVANSLLAIESGISAEVEVDRGIFGTEVTVDITHSIPAPGVFQYLGIEDILKVSGTSKTIGFNGSDFVRNVDLAEDLVTYILEQFGIDANGIMNNMNGWITTITVV